MAKKKAIGRPRRLKQAENRNAMLRALRDGCSLSDAAAIGGCCYRTLLNRRRSDSSFEAEVRKAELEGKRTLIKRAGQKKPDWLLSAKWPEEFARKDRYTLKQIDESFQAVFGSIVNLIDEEKQQIARDIIREKIMSLAVQGGEIPDHGNDGK